jgi:hypothetical protein
VARGGRFRVESVLQFAWKTNSDSGVRHGFIVLRCRTSM